MSRHATCPYRSVPDYQRWDRAFAEARAARLDPYAGQSAPFRFTRTDRIATVGSCFAQNISRRLARHGYNFLRTEYDERLTPEENDRRGNTLFSARYGNVYTAQHLVQLIDRAYGRWHPAEDCWETGGRYHDPFRPSVDQGFASPEELMSARAAHLAAVRQVFEEADVFVFTLGLTEAWVSRTDGAVYPICPGCGYGAFDPARHEFRNFSYAETCDSLVYAVRRLREINPKLRIILTVSPVPLAATMADRHVLLSTSLSKSVLRAACDAVVREHAFVEYFAAFEIVNFGRNMSSYFEGDLRAIADDGIDHVMEVFFRRYCGEEIAAGDKFEKSVCDEDLLVAGGQDARVIAASSAEPGPAIANDTGLQRYKTMPECWPHPATLWRGKPGALTPAGRKLDSLGFHNRRPVTDFMAPHQRRVCIIGNSAVMEMGLDPEESLTGCLQHDLSAHGFANTHASNCGIAGTVSQQDLSNLLHNVIDMQPSMVVVMTGGTEFQSALCYDPRPGYPRLFFLWEAVIQAFQLEASDSTLTAKLADFEVAHGRMRADVGYLSAAWFDGLIAQYTANVIKIARVCEGFRIPCILINQPTSFTFKLDHERVRARGGKAVSSGEFFELEAVIRSGVFAQVTREWSGDYVVLKDFAAVFDGLPERPYSDRLHLTRPGNAILAGEIMRIIKERERFLSALA